MRSNLLSRQIHIPRSKGLTLDLDRRDVYEFDLHESFVAVIEQISRLARVDSYYTEKKLTT